MLGADVTFEKLNFSLLAGTVEAQGVTVAGHNPAVPVLTVRRLRAEIALGAAMKKHFVVKSLTLEAPVVTLARGADGRLNLPTRFRPTDAPSPPPPPPSPPPPPASAGPASVAGGQTTDDASDPDVMGEAAGSWSFEARKVLLVDGEVHVRDASSGYHFSLEQMLAEIKEADGGLEFTLIVDSAGRRDAPAELGQVRMTGRADHVPDLSHWQRASIRATVEVADALRARVEVPSLNPPEATAEVNGAVDLAALPALLPAGVEALDALRSRGLRGRVELTARASYTAADGLRVPEFVLRGVELALGAASDAVR